MTTLSRRLEIRNPLLKSCKAVFNNPRRRKPVRCWLTTPDLVEISNYTLPIATVIRTEITTSPAAMMTDIDDSTVTITCHARAAHTHQYSGFKIELSFTSAAGVVNEPLFEDTNTHLTASLKQGLDNLFGNILF